MEIVILILFIILLFLFFRNIKILKLSSVNLFTGELGTGKSALSLNRAIHTYRENLIRFFIFYVFKNALAVFNGLYFSFDEKPILYSNIPLRNIKYIPLTNDILLRKVRINNKSVVFIDEISLVCDNMDYKDNEINYNLKMFIKLFRHYSHGGKMFINTQNIQDNHYIIKRCINRYFYIQSKLRLPFISILRVREMLYSEDGNIQNNITEDLEDNLKLVFVSNSIFKKYDSICYSILTDDLKFIRNGFKYIKSRKDLKTKTILKVKN